MYLVVSKAGVYKVISTLKSLNPLYFVLAVLIYICTLYISTIRWRLLLPDDLRTKKLFSLYLIGSLFNHVLPGMVGGDAVKAYYLYKDTGKAPAAIASVFMDRYVGFTGLMFIGVAAFPFGLRYFHGSYIEWMLPAIIALFLVASFVIFRIKIGRKIKFLFELYEYFALYKNKHHILFKAFLISVFVQVLVVLAVYLLCLGMGLNVPLVPMFIFIPIITTLAMVPVSISGIGIREASFVLLLGSLGVSSTHATAVAFAWFLSLVTGSLPGLIEYLRYEKKTTG